MDRSKLRTNSDYTHNDDWNALPRSEERFRHLFDNSRLGIFRTTLDGKVLIVNAEMARMVGYASPEEAIDVCDNLVDQLYADPKQRQKLIVLLSEQGVVKRFECKAKKKNGKIFWISIDADLTPEYDEKGQVYSVLGVCRNITGHKQLENIQTFLAQTSSGSNDEPFSKSLACYLSQCLNMDFVCIVRNEANGLQTKSVATWYNGQFIDTETFGSNDKIYDAGFRGVSICPVPANRFF